MGAWNHTSGGMHGTMRCTACGKQVESGRYRYRQKSARGDWHYQVQHEACCPDDPTWAEWDRQNRLAAIKRVELSNACKEFKAKWGLSELDDYILEDYVIEAIAAATGAK